MLPVRWIEWQERNHVEYGFGLWVVESHDCAAAHGVDHLVAVPKRHLASFTTIGASDEADVRALLAVVQRLAREVEEEHGAAAVLTNLGTYQDSKHLHVHVHSGAQLRA